MSAWLIAQLQIYAIAGARSTDRSIDNAQAANVHLTAEDIAHLDRIGLQVTDYLDDSPVMWNF